MRFQNGGLNIVNVIVESDFVHTLYMLSPRWPLVLTTTSSTELLDTETSDLRISKNHYELHNSMHVHRS